MTLCLSVQVITLISSDDAEHRISAVRFLCAVLRRYPFRLFLKFLTNQDKLVIETVSALS
jgi:hypothetical protein